ncbi:MAG: bacillithiol biosynthesis deacetylase BshB1 [Acidobacteriota bacterium]
MTGTTLQTGSLDVLAIGAHPDDVELGCGGTLAVLARAGRRVGILHLTRGEAGTRGTVAERRAEAEAAAEALGAAELQFLDCGDGALRHGTEEEDALIRVLRRLRPEVVLGPTPSDRHPDHGRAHRLVADACFYAGLAGRAAGEGPSDSGPAPFRPAAFHAYMQHDQFEPSFIVDVTAGWDAKQRALDAYESQIFQGGDGSRSRPEPQTKVASREFRAAVEGRARHFGLLIGAAYGEPFRTRLPVAVPEPGLLLDLVPGGVR